MMGLMGKCFPGRELALRGGQTRRSLVGVRTWSAVALTLLGLLATLVPFAYASPVDPTWFAGVYDNGDADEAVLLALTTAKTAAPTDRIVLDVVRRDDGPAAPVQGPVRPVVPAAPSHLTRAPPSR
jgi:hypothetical protein